MKLLTFLTLMTCCAFAMGGRFMCYFPNWSYSRTGLGQFTVDQIDTNLCTHYIYSFTVLDEDTLTIKVQDQFGDIDNGGFSKFVALKQKNPQLKLMVAIGGWTDSTDGTGKYSRLVSSQQNIDNFVASVVTFLDTYKFDGLDVDWEYPNDQPTDKAGFANLLIALRRALSGKYLLSAAVSSAQYVVDTGYDVPTLNQQLDFLNLMTYDMHGSWEAQVDHHAPLRQRPWEAASDNNIDYSVKYWISQGMSAAKINVGIPLYGRSWTLSDSTNTAPQAPASGAGPAGPYTGEEGFLSYYEVCLNVQNDNWAVVTDSENTMGPYALSPDSPATWVGYDDVAMATVKSQYINSMGLGGAMVWDVSLDDFGNVCGGGANPLMTAIHRTVVGGV